MASASSGRSKAYPAIDLREARAFLADFVTKLGWGGSHTRGEIARKLGYAATSGAALRRIAALVHFRLLIRRGGQYRLSDLGRSVLDESRGPESRALLREAFLGPKLFRGIVDRYECILQTIDESFSHQLVKHRMCREVVIGVRWRRPDDLAYIGIRLARCDP